MTSLATTSHSTTTARPARWPLLVAALLGALSAYVLLGVIPDARHSRRRANEHAAVDTLREIAAAQTELISQRGTYGSLDELVAAELVSELEAGVKLGYHYAALADPKAPGARWMAVTWPLEMGVSGRTCFAINHDGEMHYSAQKIQLSADCAYPDHAQEGS